MCDHVVVLGRGQLLAQGDIQEMKQAHPASFEVRLKGDPAPFVERLRVAGGDAEPHDDVLLVPTAGTGRRRTCSGGSRPNSASRSGHLRPQRSTLEEVFLKAVGRRTNHADLRPGLSTLDRPAVRATPALAGGRPARRARHDSRPLACPLIAVAAWLPATGARDCPRRCGACSSNRPNRCCLSCPECCRPR